MKIDNEKLAALLHSQSAAFDKVYDLESHLTRQWRITPDSTKRKWRKRAEVFKGILEQLSRGSGQ